jgi:hypothetical protein
MKRSAICINMGAAIDRMMSPLHRCDGLIIFWGVIVVYGGFLIMNERDKTMKKPGKQFKFGEELIAPCGMNCGVCRAYVRQNNACLGCNVAGQKMPKTRECCVIRLCEKRNGKFCYDCDEFPCDRLKTMDRRYRTKYEMSEIENLEFIRDHGLKKFLQEECKKRISEKGILCVHDKKYYQISK